MRSNTKQARSKASRGKYSVREPTKNSEGADTRDGGKEDVKPLSSERQQAETPRQTPSKSTAKAQPASCKQGADTVPAAGTAKQQGNQAGNGSNKRKTPAKKQAKDEKDVESSDSESEQEDERMPGCSKCRYNKVSYKRFWAHDRMLCPQVEAASAFTCAVCGQSLSSFWVC